MTDSKAWLLNCGTSLTLAVGDYEMLEYLEPRTRYFVPGAPVYCGSVVEWQDNLVPVMDVAVLLGQSSQQDASYLSLLAYQAAPMQPLQHFAIPVNSAPQIVDVSDEQACELSEELELSLLKNVSLSCFVHADQPVLIIDLAMLCSAGYRDFIDEFVKSTA